MLPLLVLGSLAKVHDSDPLITQELVDRINNDPHSTFKAKLYPQFAKMTVGEAKKFLAPVRKSPVNHGSPRPVGANENHFLNHDKRVLTGFYNARTTEGAANLGKTMYDTGSNKYKYTVYDNAQFCSSWAAAVTSAMSLALSIHHRRFVNLSIQFILDCDLMGDPCVERPPLNAYEQFWKRYVPQADRWDQPSNFLRTPYHTLDAETCHKKDGCYPGWSSCPRNLVMTGNCDPGTADANCPIYFLYNWRWIKSHLWEVGPVTSSILVRPAFFTYEAGVYSSTGWSQTTAIDTKSVPATFNGDILGMLDVTIIGWGQYAMNLSQKSTYHTSMYNRWWFVIPHLGKSWGALCSEVFGAMSKVAPEIGDDTAEGEMWQYIDICASAGTRSGIVRFNRRFDDSNIESQAVGAVPYNFIPNPYRSK